MSESEEQEQEQEKKKYIMAVIKIPIEVAENDEYNSFLDRAIVTFEECDELPPIQDHDSIDLVGELSRLLSGQEDIIPLGELRRAKKPLNSSFKKYHLKSKRKSRIQYTSKVYS